MPPEFKSSIEQKAANLPDELHERLRDYASEGKSEEFFLELNEFGLSTSNQQELASHFFKELEQSINLISWTKKRLSYFEAILENTLQSENPQITSSENLIRNYLIFSKIFEKEEEKLPRFGQFAYAVKSVFRGVTTQEEIEERIAQHKTFGERRNFQESRQKEIIDNVEKTAKEFEAKIAQTRSRKKEFETTFPEGAKEEKYERGTEWSISYTPPHEFYFPDYTFQTGELKGKNSVNCRSSWEAVFFAFTDFINQRMEEGIRNSTMSPEEQEEQIKKRHITLFYEPFQFPVDIKAGANGKEKAVIYIPDFIDLNRWRVTEIKGPLKETAAEKIRLFKKYYVDGDFSELPDDKKILMMGYVQQILERVRNFCKERQLPTFEHFSNMEVFGAFRWDWDLNNFNSYENVKQIKNLPQTTKDKLQKGLITFIEEKVASHKFPDFRVKGFASTNDLKTIESNIKKGGGGGGIPFVIKEHYGLKPYSKEIFLKEYSSRHNPLEDYALPYVLDTLPMREEEKKAIIASHQLQEELRLFFALLNEVAATTTDSEKTEILKGGSQNMISVPNNFLMPRFMNNLKVFRRYLQENKIKEFDQKIGKRWKIENLLGDLQNLTSLVEKKYQIKKNLFVMDRKVYEFGQINKELINLPTVMNSYGILISGDNAVLMAKRVRELSLFAEANENPSQNKKSLDNLTKRIMNNRHGTFWDIETLAHHIASLTLKEAGAPFEYLSTISFLTQLEQDRYIPYLDTITFDQIVAKAKKDTKFYESLSVFSNNRFSPQEYKDIVEVVINNEDKAEIERFLHNKKQIITELYKAFLHYTLGTRYQKLTDVFEANKQTYFTDELKGIFKKSR